MSSSGAIRRIAPDEFPAAEPRVQKGCLFPELFNESEGTERIVLGM